MTDHRARHILNLREKSEAVVVGGGICIGLLCIVANLLTGSQLVLIAGMTLIGMAFPFAYVFTNESRSGVWLFGFLGAFVIFTGILCFVDTAASLNLSTRFFVLNSFLIVMATTWLVNVKSLRS